MSATAPATSEIRLKTQAFQHWQRLKGWSDFQTATALKVSPGFLSRILSGDRSPGAKFIGRLIKISGMPFETFFEVT